LLNKNIVSKSRIENISEKVKLSEEYLSAYSYTKFRQSNIAEQESEIINDSLSAILDLYNQNIESKNKIDSTLEGIKKLNLLQFKKRNTYKTHLQMEKQELQKQEQCIVNKLQILSKFFDINSLKDDLKKNDVGNLIEFKNRYINILINHLNDVKTLKLDLSNEVEILENQERSIASNLKILSEFFDITSLTENIGHLELLIQHSDSIVQICKYFEILKQLTNLGLGSFWQSAVDSKIPKNDIESIFINTLYTKILDQALRQNYEIRNTESIKEDVNTFRTLDKNSFVANVAKFKYNFAQKILDTVNQSSKIQKLLSRSKFNKPRKLISDYKNEILSIFGCVVCSPLTICQYFDIEDTTEPIFDTVIFDEASQVCTWDAVSSIIRARQMIVAGDSEQMPPMNYFSSLSYHEDEEDEWDEEDENKVGNYQSLLDFLNTKLQSLSLRWHYRSKYEQLIAPSNKEIYDNKLITFPSPDASIKPIEFIYIESAIWDKGRNEIEAKQVVQKLKQLYMEGKKSVGVVAMNSKQSQLIQDLIETDEDLTSWYLEDDNDGLFVKHLENCQGDERDIIVISLTFAKNKDSKIAGTTFAQINRNDSYKKLNVMFTRARESVYLFSSINSHAIPDKKDHKAYSFLRYYVQFCEAGYQKIKEQDRDHFDSSFEEDVCSALRKEGFEVHTQVGCSGYKIDLAILCPIDKDRYILGVECDGEYYHRGRTAREKDRLRQEILERKGWKVHRIWSYDWFQDKMLEVQKIRDLLC
jgi:very-short-patch-repair endonuclease